MKGYKGLEFSTWFLRSPIPSQKARVGHLKPFGLMWIMISLAKGEVRRFGMGSSLG